MESYQSVGVVIGIAGIVLGIVALFFVPYGVVTIAVSFVGLIVPLVNPKHHKAVGVTLIVLGIIGNVLMIIPGIMAVRYKPEGKNENKPQSKEQGDEIR